MAVLGLSVEFGGCSHLLRISGSGQAGSAMLSTAFTLSTAPAHPILPMCSLLKIWKKK